MLPKESSSLNRTTREWLSMALKSKCGQDYMCAMAYLVNSYPLHAIGYLDTLISFVSPSKKRDCFRSLDILNHLFSNLIPKNRALIPVKTRPLDVLEKLNSSSKENILCLWHFEDELKKIYLRFIKASELILNIIINKLGDRSKEFASAVIHKLRLIAGISSNFLHLVVQEVRSFLFRPNLLERSKYYAISLLSCLELKSSSHGSGTNVTVSSVASTLIKIYMSFFRSLASSKEIPERLVTVLLSGLCRVTPFITEEAFTSMLSEVDDLFRLVHTTGFTVSVQALSVLFQISTHCISIRDRYYQALYRKLLDPAIHQSSKNPILLRLIYQSMISDDDTDRIAAFFHRILQLCLSHTDPGFIVGCLILINKVSLSKPNLLIVSQINQDQLSVNPMTNLAKFEQSNGNDDDDDDEDEHFSDAHCSDDDEDANADDNDHDESVQKNNVIINDKSTLMTDKNQNVSSWYHRSLRKQRNIQNVFGYGYNPTAREPKFAQAAGCLLWPLNLLAKHNHPTINLFANSLLNQLPIQYTGDPFIDFGLMHFLDRFSYKKPKLNKLTGVKSTADGPVQKSMLAMELTFSSTKQLTKITCLIHVNGKITIFYDEIASGNHETELDSKIYSSFKCGEGSPGSLPYNAIHVPGSWIQSNTLVELEPMTNFCSRQQSSESCKAASKPGVICYWCATAEICSNGLDTHTAVLRQNNCHKEIIEKLTGDNLEDIDIQEKNKYDPQMKFTSVTSSTCAC
ncbi:unnamed protein product [Schistosoma turkestanicum]|nr:unnamed protein product [Schistosoma turkestanicum]